MATPTEQEDTQGYKVFNDPIHGSMELHPLLVKIIDTPQFQRLRNIKQLGGAHWVFLGASHTRFEHSIGVCYLAGQLVKALQDRQGELNITDEDVLCVQIAGLCHDLGRGPFSHVFAKMFMPRARPEEKWTHERASMAMFRHMVDMNNLGPVIYQYNLDQDFIGELIERPQNSDIEWPYKGQTKDKSFLYEIVANKRNGVDVDKWDWFARDCHYLGIRNNFDYRRFIAFARVCKDENGKRQLCIRDKVFIHDWPISDGVNMQEIGNVSDMFQTRRSLHLKAYQHPLIRVVEIMIAEAFLEADQHLDLSEAIRDPRAYTKLTDHVFDEILNSSDDDLENARTILCNIVTRKFYKFVGQTLPFAPKMVPKEVLDDLKKKLATIKDETGVSLKPESDFVFDTIEIDHRIKNEDPNDMERINPLLNVRTYSKKQPNVATKTDEEEMSELFPHNLAQDQIRVYLKRTDELSQDTQRILDEATAKFKEWRDGPFKAWIKDVLKADEKLKLSKPIDDIESDTELADHVFNQTLTFDDPDPKKPMEIFEKIPECDFYKFVGQTLPEKPLPSTQEQRRSLEIEIAQTVPEGSGPNVDLQAENFVVDIVSIIPGNSNPQDTGTPISETQRSVLPPNSLAMQLILVYCKKTDDTSMQAARRKFRQWCICCGYTQWMVISTPPEEASGTAGGDEEQPEETGSDQTGTSHPDEA